VRFACRLHRAERAASWSVFAASRNERDESWGQSTMDFRNCGGAVMTASIYPSRRTDYLSPKRERIIAQLRNSLDHRWLTLHLARSAARAKRVPNPPRKSQPCWMINEGSEGVAHLLRDRIYYPAGSSSARMQRHPARCLSIRISERSVESRIGYRCG